MKLLILGAGGMAGHVVATHLAEIGHDVDTLSASNRLDDNTTLLDVTDKERLLGFFNEHTYDAIINCIGTLVKQSEERQHLAAYLNAYFPHFLEETFKDTPTKIVHLSTDCVFSGKNAPYKEDSDYDGQLFYDRSKALGEIKNDKDLTLRMSIIGPDMQETGIGLFNWFYAQTGEIGGFTKAIWNGITTIELAKGIDAALSQNLTGLYHLVPNTNISKYDLLKLFAETFERHDISVSPSDKLALNKTLVNTRTDFDYVVPSYSVMLNEMRHWVTTHPSLYKHYVK